MGAIQVQVQRNRSQIVFERHLYTKYPVPQSGGILSIQSKYYLLEKLYGRLGYWDEQDEQDVFCFIEEGMRAEFFRMPLSKDVQNKVLEQHAFLVGLKVSNYFSEEEENFPCFVILNNGETYEILNAKKLCELALHSEISELYIKYHAAEDQVCVRALCKGKENFLGLDFPIGISLSAIGSFVF